MKRLLWPICVVLVAIVLFSGFGGTEGGIPQEQLSVSEAAFAMRTSDSEDATSFLVGRFVGDQGTSLRFDGVGGVWMTSANLDIREGTTVLSQCEGGVTLLQIDFGGAPEFYTFQLVSAKGAFLLTDAAGAVETFQPLL